MSWSISAPAPGSDPIRLSLIRITLALAASAGIFAVIVMWPAGRIDWTAGWLYVGITTLYLAINVVYLERVNPGLVAARMRYGKGTKRWDTVWGVVFAPILLSVYVVAGFDAVRFGWATMSASFWPLGLIVFAAGAALLSWSMGVNPFFEKTVRIQDERGHRVIDTGPYAFVRHPGYLGFFGWCLSPPLLLGSWWAFVPAVLSVAAVIVRAALEDRTLREELDGYVEYSRRVPYRLWPGVW